MVYDYPEHEFNPAPHGEDEPAWRAWAESLPVLADFGVRCAAIGPGHVVLVLDESPVTLNPNGSVHGGIVAAIADGALGCAFVPSVEPGVLPATASLTVEYHRPAFPPLTFAGSIASQGRTLMFCDVHVTDRDGKACSRAHGVMAIKGRSG
jgi:uncharacterized protein (TIGR00369 family)